MKKLITSLTFFLVFCAAPFIGLLLTKIGYPEFKTDIGFAWVVGVCVAIGVCGALILYFDDKTN